ncbi:MAG: hypothetical protein AMS27_13170 [Bacteroides sp. SM23_62_1]|nr:MAG: hypothetical protein AMS27_13170 [Bacteroides sp. SM23_62_1]
MLSLLLIEIFLLLIEIFLPVFNRLMEKDLEFSVLKDPQVFIIFIGLTIIIGLFSGSYPAFYLSSFNAYNVLKGELSSGISASIFRSILIVLQFFLALILIICSLFNKQLNYIKNKDLGFNKDQVIIVPLHSEELIKNYQTVKEEIEKLPFIKSISASQNYPGAIFSGNSFKFIDEGETEKLVFSSIDIDEDFLQTYEIALKLSRNFSDEFLTDNQALIINEAAMKFMGWDNPLGKQAIFNDIPGYTVIGVVKDFHFASLREKLEPVILLKREFRFRYLNIKLVPDNIDRNLQQLALVWENIDPDRPFEYFFLDTSLEKLYQNEKRMTGIFSFFTTLAIIIALL